MTINSVDEDSSTGSATEDVKVEVGTPEGRLRARDLTGEVLRYLSIDFDSHAIAASPDKWPSGGGSVVIPGYDPAAGRVAWSLVFDDLTTEDVERFLNELRAQGCPIERAPSR